jgi:LCP family protein required for cell wall assembly
MTDLPNFEPRYDPNGETRPFEQGIGEPNGQIDLAQYDEVNINSLFEDNSDPNADTQPVRVTDPMERLQPVPVPRKPARPAPARPAKKTARKRPGCSLIWVILLALVLYFFAPLRTNILIMGVDRTPDGSALGRTDTIILTSINPLLPTVRMLSIPRDLYLEIPNQGQNRINTAHFFAEIEQEGSGPRALSQVVRENFGVNVPYFVRFRFDGFLSVIDAMGGVTVQLSEPMAGYPAGTHQLNAEEALAFARNRSGTDDFFRMEQGQLLVRSVINQFLNPTNWVRAPVVFAAAWNAVDTNVPFWQWPRLGFALARAAIFGIDSRTLSREMTTPYLTEGGAQVLLPNWDMIRPMIREMFGARLF